jgi:hypothetical protein
MSSGAAFFIASARAFAFYQLALTSDGRLRGLRADHFPDDRKSSGPAALERMRHPTAQGVLDQDFK